MTTMTIQCGLLSRMRAGDGTLQSHLQWPKRYKPQFDKTPLTDEYHGIVNKLVYGISFTKVNEFLRFWGTQLLMCTIYHPCTITHAMDTRPFFRPSVTIEKKRPGTEASLE